MEQRYNDFTKALNHLNMAREIRPRAYQIQHAIARNYLKHANMEKDRTVAESLFQTGEDRMLELIDSRESYKQKAKYFSIHCYAYEKIRFWEKYPDLITKKSCRNLKHYIDMAVSGKDEFADQLVVLFMKFLVRNDLVSIVNMGLRDKYFQALQECGVKDANMDTGVNTDVLIDSY